MGAYLQLYEFLAERWSLPIRKTTLQSASIALLLLAFAGWSSASTTTQSKTKHAKASSTHHSSASHHSSKRAKKTAHSRGQRNIDEQRTIAIQNALIREHYLSGQPTGVWDQASKEAMLRYQADNGWQTKITPDSRALIKLGLGPDHSGLLNPETANIPSPHELGVDSATQPGGASDNQ